MGFLAPRALDEATLQKDLDEIVEMLLSTNPFYLDRTGGSLEKRAKVIGRGVFIYPSALLQNLPQEIDPLPGILRIFIGISEDFVCDPRCGSFALRALFCLTLSCRGSMVGQFLHALSKEGLDFFPAWVINAIEQFEQHIIYRPEFSIRDRFLKTVADYRVEIDSRTDGAF